MSWWRSETVANESVSKSGDIEVLHYSKPRRVVRSLYLCILAYFIISGGPFGMESAVRAAGPLITLLGLLLMPLIWALPQVLMTAELSCMMSEINGGYIVWVERAFGDFISWMNSYNNLVCNIVDAAIYPVIVADYFQDTLKIHSPWQLWLIKVLMLLVCLYMNVRGIELVGQVAVVLSIVVLAPFVVMFFYRYPDMSVDQWTYVPPSDEIRWSLYLSTMLWLYSGFDDTGSLAGEVDEPAKTYVRGLWGAVFLVLLSYLIPFVVALSLTPIGDYHRWHDGYFAKAATETAPWLGNWVLLGVMLSNVAQYNSDMAADSRAIWAMSIGAGGGSTARKLPGILSWSYESTPVAAIIFQTVAILFAMAFPFKILVQCDTFFNCITLILEFAAFMYLKYYEPDTPRPFKVPCGKFGAWMITIPKLLLIGVIFYLAKPKIFKVGLICNAIFIVLYVCKCAYQRFFGPKTTRSQDPEETPLLSSSPNS